jgi:DNA-binding Lrp family transcriptional regulator
MSGQTVDFRLLNDFQRDFPLLPAPFAQIALRLGVTENVVLRSLETLRREGKIARVGAVFAPRRIGASTLAALAVPPDRLAAVAATVNRFPEVNHNYEREHAYNLWFVVTAGSEDRLRAALAAIEQAADCRLLRLPLVREYHIDLGFALHGDDSARKTVVAQRPFDTAMPPLSEVERRLVMALQEGLPLFFRPFAVLASRVGCEEDEVIERLRHWCANGVISASASWCGIANSVTRRMRCWCTTFPTRRSTRSANGWRAKPASASATGVRACSRNGATTCFA